MLQHGSYISWLKSQDDDTHVLVGVYAQMLCNTADHTLTVSTSTAAEPHPHIALHRIYVYKHLHHVAPWEAM